MLCVGGEVWDSYSQETSAHTKSGECADTPPLLEYIFASVGLHGGYTL